MGYDTKHAPIEGVVAFYTTTPPPPTHPNSKLEPPSRTAQRGNIPSVGHSVQSGSQSEVGYPVSRSVIQLALRLASDLDSTLAETKVNHREEEIGNAHTREGGDSLGEPSEVVGSGEHQP